MVPPNITESLATRLPAKNAKDDNGVKLLRSVPPRKEILVQDIEAKTDLGGQMSMECGHLDFFIGGDGDGSKRKWRC